MQQGGQKANIFLNLKPEPTSNMETVDNKAKSFYCNTCDSKFGNRSKQIKHIRTVHKSLMPFECSFCPSKFAEKSDEFEHKRDFHRKIKLKTFECSLCDSKYFTNTLLNKHMRQKYSTKTHDSRT